MYYHYLKWYNNDIRDETVRIRLQGNAKTQTVDAAVQCYCTYTNKAYFLILRDYLNMKEIKMNLVPPSIMIEVVL